MEGLTRMNAALELLERNLDERLNIAEAAKAAYMSPFHFQRMFHILTGMTVAEYARKRKLTLAAQELASSGSKVVDVALKYGYDSPESFAKAFRKIHGIPPSEARSPGVRLKAFPRISFQLSLKGEQDMDYRIVEKDAFAVAGRILQTSCANNEHSRRIPQFWQECHGDGTVARLADAATGGNLYGVCLDMEPGKEEITYMIAAAVDAERPPEGFAVREIPASTWAVFVCEGQLPDSIQITFRRIFQEWFPSTGYEHSGGPELEVYPEGDTASADYRCEVWIPVVKK